MTPNAFYLQLRRLESLQLLMTQGSSVVNEVIEFMAKARAEIDVLRRDQENTARTQEMMVSENLGLQSRVADMERSLESADVRAKEQELLANQLRQEMARNSAPISKELENERERHRKTLKECDRASETKELLLHQNLLLRREIEQLRSEEETKRRIDIGSLQLKIGALEKQLAAERERRIRLMEVLKLHEVKIAGRVPVQESV